MEIAMTAVKPKGEAVRPTARRQDFMTGPNGLTNRDA